MLVLGSGSLPPFQKSQTLAHAMVPPTFQVVSLINSTSLEIPLQMLPEASVLADSKFHKPEQHQIKKKTREGWKGGWGCL